MHAKILPAAVAALLLAGSVSADRTEPCARPGSQKSIANFKDKIKTVVFLIMENRSVDNLLGGQNVKGLDIPLFNGPFCNPVDINKPHGERVCSKATDYNSILDDPDHSISGNNVEFFSTFTPDNEAIASGALTPDMQGFIWEQTRLYGESGSSNTTLIQEVMNYYTEEEIPLITYLTHNFTTFNHWHSDLPGPTEPNRLFSLSGTSWGMGNNSFDHDTIPVKSIFQAVDEAGLTWKNYMFGMQDAAYYTWTIDNNKTGNIVSINEFYADAAAGTLPNFTYLTPNCCGVGTNSMHPTGLISDGEAYLKGIYEALRAGPQWNETLWVLTFDETGGFHDHVPPPTAPRPDDRSYTETTPTGEDYTFRFDRLGGRVPTWLISPWVAPRVVQKGLNRAGERTSYSASSLISTLAYLWDFEPFNPRVEHAPTFDHLILRQMRDTPETLPDVIEFNN